MAVRRIPEVPKLVGTILAIELGIPAFLVYSTYTHGPAGWWPWLVVSGAAIAGISAFLPWCQFVPYFVLPVPALAMIAAAWHAGGGAGAGAAAAILLAAYALFRRWANRGYSRAPAIEISPPLALGLYFVAQGGGGSGVNHHFVHDSQRYALDVLRLNWAAMRAWGFFPRRLGLYAISGTPVLSPVDGVVTGVVDGLPDMEPLAQQDTEHIAGNHVVIARQGDAETYVGLAHLRAGSIRVRVGEKVLAGQPVGLVGNSGNTSEPHLHIHAKTGGEPGCMFDGQGVAIRIRGRLLMRNDLFRGRSPGRAAGAAARPDGEAAMQRNPGEAPQAAAPPR